jgi:hypothetical protein
MSLPSIEVLFDEDRTQFEPGETLSGQFLVSVEDVRELKAVEISVLWHTEGKGDEDLAVHHFERIDVQNGMGADLRRPVKFSTKLPNSPLSYTGAIVRIDWCVRVRAFPLRGDEILKEEFFQLGDVPPAEAGDK